MYKLFAITTAILITASSSAMAASAGGSACTAIEKQLASQITKIRSKQTGGFNDPSVGNPAYVDPDVMVGEQLLKQAQQSKCNLSSAMAPQLERGQGTQTDPQLTPAAPGETDIAPDPTFNPEFDPSKFLKDLVPTDTAAEEKKDEEVIAPPTTGTGGGCGQQAVDSLAALKSQTGANRPTYKEGCAGTNPSGVPQTSSNGSGSSCTGNEVGKFGLVEAVYSNGAQNIDVTSLLGKTPGNITAGSAVAFRDSHTGVNSEPSGCRLSNYSSCGKAGDIILVQSGTSGTSNSGFDTYLIYDGKGGFYEAVNSSQAIQSGALNPLYNSASYAAVRLGCSAGPTSVPNP